MMLLRYGAECQAQLRSSATPGCVVCTAAESLHWVVLTPSLHGACGRKVNGMLTAMKLSWVTAQDLDTYNY